MEPYKAKKLPFEFEITNEILNLLCEAKEAYGEYKGYLKNMSYQKYNPQLPFWRNQAPADFCCVRAFFQAS